MDYRKRLFEVIEIAEEDDKVSNIYDAFMMISIIASIVPMAFKTTNMVFEIVDKVTVGIFIVDYFFRIMTADLKLKKGAKSFVIYPFTPMAIIDLRRSLHVSLLRNKNRFSSQCRGRYHC